MKYLYPKLKILRGRIMKRALSLFVSLTMVMSLLLSVTGFTLTKAGRIDVSKHISFTMNAIDVDKAGKDANGNPDPVYTWLEKKFNFDIQWIPCTWSDYALEKPQLWMASGEQPDIMFLDIAPPRYPLFLSWVKNKELKAFPTLGATYPNLQAAWDKGTNGKKFAVDGKIYAFPSFLDSAKYNFRSTKGYIYRADWAEAVGMRTKNDIYTWDQWIKLILAVQKKDPGKNGAGKTIGMLGNDWAYPRALEAARAASPYIETYTKKNGKWVWGPQLPESLTAVLITKKLYDQGIIWKDQLIVKNDEDPKNKLVAGQAFTNFGTSLTAGGYSDTANLFAAANPKIDPSKALAIAIVRAPDQRIYTEASSDHWSETALAPNLSDEKTTRWLQIQDYLTSPEGYNMRNFGIPGKDWDLKNGKVEIKWAKDAKGAYIAPSGLAWGNSWQWSYRGGTTDLAVLENPTTPKWIRDQVTKLAERMQQSDVVVLPFNTELNYFNAPNYNKVGTMEQAIYQEIAKLMVSKNVAKDWTEWVKSQDASIKPVLDELNAQLK
jgi:putative aldouronate transport system substrate-binding protein